VQVVKEGVGEFFEGVFVSLAVRLSWWGWLFIGSLGAIDDDYGSFEIQNIFKYQP